jgi:hypothetical protein
MIFLMTNHKALYNSLLIQEQYKSMLADNPNNKKIKKLVKIYWIEAKLPLKI